MLRRKTIIGKYGAFYGRVIQLEIYPVAAYLTVFVPQHRTDKHAHHRIPFGETHRVAHTLNVASIEAHTGIYNSYMCGVDSRMGDYTADTVGCHSRRIKTSESLHHTTVKIQRITLSVLFQQGSAGDK